jgi:hypothetical protein
VRRERYVQMMKRPHGTGRLYVKWGSYYGRWRLADGRYVNRGSAKMRQRGESDGLTRRDAERALCRLVEETSKRPPATPEERRRTVDEVGEALRDRLETEGRVGPSRFRHRPDRVGNCDRRAQLSGHDTRVPAEVACSCQAIAEAKPSEGTPHGCPAHPRSAYA